MGLRVVHGNRITAGRSGSIAKDGCKTVLK
jgi:hypothetical protein